MKTFMGVRLDPKVVAFLQERGTNVSKLCRYLVLREIAKFNFNNKGEKTWTYQCSICNHETTYYPADGICEDCNNKGFVLSTKAYVATKKKRNS